VAISERFTTVQYGELKRFVNRYIRTRARPVNDGNRVLVEAAIRRYPGRFPADLKALEQFLDAELNLKPAS